MNSQQFFLNNPNGYTSPNQEIIIESSNSNNGGQFSHQNNHNSSRHTNSNKHSNNGENFQQGGYGAGSISEEIIQTRLASGQVVEEIIVLNNNQNSNREMSHGKHSDCNMHKDHMGHNNNNNNFGNPNTNCFNQQAQYAPESVIIVEETNGGQPKQTNQNVTLL
jgi:hypothetical protein